MRLSASLTISRALTLTTCIVTVALLTPTHAQFGNFWNSEPPSANPTYSPEDARVSSPPEPQSREERLAQARSRLQVFNRDTGPRQAGGTAWSNGQSRYNTQQYGSPVYNQGNSGYYSDQNAYNYPQNPGYNPPYADQGYYPDRNRVNSNSRYNAGPSNQGFAPPVADITYASNPNSRNHRPDPSPPYHAHYPSHNPGYLNPGALVPDRTLTQNDPGNQYVNVQRPNMRPAPQNVAVNDRSREAQNSFFDQWMAQNSHSFWDQSGTRDRQALRVPTTTTTPAPTTTVTTPPPVRVNPNYFQSNGAINRLRLGMFRAPANRQEDTPRDRQAAMSDYDRLIASLTSSNFFTNTANRARSRAENEGSVPRPKAPQAQLPIQIEVKAPEGDSETTDNQGPPMYDKPYVGVTDEFLTANYTRREGSNATRSSDATRDITARASSLNRRDSQEAAHSRQFTPDGKLYQSEVYSDTLQAENTKLDSVNGVKAGEEDGGKKEGETRTRRQASQEEFMSDGISCRTPAAFPRCQYYPRCFAELDQECRSRGSFIGDDVSTICGDLQNLSSNIESDVLRNFLSDVASCVDVALLDVLEWPSCDDVTDRLAHALLVEGEDNCIAKSEHFCTMLETPVARFNLARVFYEPRGREEFLLRLLVSLGNHTSRCPGPGANIFLLDLLSNVMHSNTTYMMPGGQPMPLFEP